MRRAIAVALSLGLLMGAFALPADAAKKKKKKKKPKKIERVVEFEYVCPCPGFYQLGGLTGTNIGGGPLQPEAKEIFVKVTSEDISGTSILVNIQQDLDGDGGNNPVAEVCAPPGEAEDQEPAEINEGLEMRLFITTGTCDGGASVPLGGTLTVTLSNMP